MGVWSAQTYTYLYWMSRPNMFAVPARRPILCREGLPRKSNLSCSAHRFGKRRRCTPKRREALLQYEYVLNEPLGEVLWIFA